MRPFDDLGCTFGVLRLDCVPYVSELAVFEDEEAVTAGYARQAGARAGGRVVVPVGDEVVVGFQDDNGGPYCICEVEELVGGRDVRAETEVRFLHYHQAEQVRGERMRCFVRSFCVGGFRGMVDVFGSHGFGDTGRVGVRFGESWGFLTLDWGSREQYI